VPTLIIDNQVLVQSIAILEYLEERVPKSWRLLPVEPHLRAQVRAVVQMIASDIQPVQNLRVLRRIEDEEKRKAHACQLIASGLEGRYYEL
jgi:glutathione S-transferase